MKSRFLRPHGAALIITLAMIAMMTFLVVAFFSRSVSNLQIETASTGTVRADVLARSASGVIVSDFRTEIIAGSTASGSGSQAPIYVPKTPAAAIPALSRLAFATGYDPAPFVNLVKQSTGRFFPNVAPYTGANAQPIIQAVTEDPTDTVSANGRTVVGYRWDYPATTSPLGPVLCIGDLTYSHFYKSTMLPHWIVMTRDGVPAAQVWNATWKNYSPENAGAAIGRFAYNIYNVGGLLDANVAGYDEAAGSTTAPTPAAIGQKGTLGLAKLSVLPGMGTSPETNATNFAKAWRNAASGSATNDYLAYLGFSKNGTTDITSSPFFLAGPKAGFMRAAAGTTSADNRVLGRQDLIRLATKANSPYGLTLTTLPYLTHFSREVNAPSWSPPLNASQMGGANDGITIGGPSGIYSYKDNKDNASFANRFIPNVRVGANPTWRRLTGELAVEGEPLIKYRFPLSWLALLQDDTPSTTTWELTKEAKVIIKNLDARNTANGGSGLPGITDNDKAAYVVQHAFGLTWDTANNRWAYIGSAAPNSLSSPVLSTLDVLGTVTVQNREPNFFELLKAGILSGSLGSASDFEGMCVSMGEDALGDGQVIQIGANIIDQADSDSYPTLIAFGHKWDYPAGINSALINPRSSSNPPVELSEVKVYAGVEDLPYMYSFLETPYRIPAGETNLAPHTNADIPPNTQNDHRENINGWLQFVVWKPHQASANAGAAPPKFRILFQGTDVHMLYWGPDGTDAANPPVTFPPPNPPTTSGGPTYGSFPTEPALAGTAFVNFVDNTDFRVPTLLGGLDAATAARHGFYCSQAQGNGQSPSNPAVQLPRGMWLGETKRPEMAKNVTDPYNKAPKTAFTQFRCREDTRFDLQYDQDGNGTWRTYQRYDRLGLCTGKYYGGRGLFGYADNPVSLGDEGCPVYTTAPIPNSPPPLDPTDKSPAYRSLDIATLAISAIDPRSHRFGLLAQFVETSSSAVPPGMFPNDWRYYLKQGWAPKNSPTQAYSMLFGPTSKPAGPSGADRFTPNWKSGATRQNPWQSHTALDTPITDPTKFWVDNAIPASGSITMGYRDVDLVQRRGDGDATNSSRPIQLSYVSGAVTPNSQDLGRVLNRPFRSVGELAYAFRDEPYKSLNLFTDKSADSGLLDLFSVTDQPAILAGKVDLNTRNPEVLQAVIIGAAREELSTTNVINSADALKIANALVANTSAAAGTNTGPLMNPAEIGDRLNTILPLVSTDPNTTIKTRREVVGRALSGSGQTRTWNFLVDIIAQSGRFGSDASKTAQFIVEGERHYWLHVAIDRYTGQVVDQQLEHVME